MISETQPTAADAQRVLAMSLGVAQTQIVATAARLGLADLLADGPRLASELARAVRAEPAALNRLLAAMAELGLVRRTPRGYALTATGSVLRVDSPLSVHHYALLMGSAWLGGAWPLLAVGVRDGTSQFAAVHGMSIYEYNQQHPDAGSIMQQAMSEMSVQEGRALLQAYDLSGVARLVDVGGGRGLLVATLLRAYPDLRATLLELPGVAEAARVTLADDDLVGRCEVVAGDYLEQVPGKGEVYLLKRVLMDRPDEQAERLLGNIRAVMAPEGRVLVADPDVSTPYGRLLDMCMLMLFGSRLRTDAEIDALFGRAGFVLTRAIPTDSSLRLFEAVPA